MTLHNDISETVRRGTNGEFALTVVFREIEEDGEMYYVAECLEIPGCVSQGSTKEEAHTNIQDAIKSCLSVIIEDTMRQIMARQVSPDLRGISSQERMRFIPKPCLEYEYA